MAQAITFLVMLSMALIASAVSGATPPPRGNCPEKCGNVTIPYPFGIGAECSLPDFHLSCDKGVLLLRGNIPIDNITLEAAQMTAYTWFTYICDMAVDSTRGMYFNLTGSPFLLSPVANIFTAVGCSSLATIRGHAGSTYLAGCITTCASVNESARDGAPCSGQGCCEASLPFGLSYVSVFWQMNNSSRAPTNRCQYAFVAKKGWYNFSRADLNGEAFIEKYNSSTWILPLILDWAIRNGSCPSPPDVGDKEKSYTPYGLCISTNSHCDNASNGEPGYLCRCNEGYTGNPYQENGCKMLRFFTDRTVELMRAIDKFSGVHRQCFPDVAGW